MEFFLREDKLEKEITCCIKTFAYVLSRTGELVLHIKTPYIIEARWVTGLAKVSSSRSPGTLFCNSMKTADNQVVEWNPDRHRYGSRKRLYEGPVNRGDNRLFISIFYDSYLSAPTRYRSVGGLYLSIMNMALKEQRKLENVQLLCLVPHGACFTQIWERYRRELVDLGSKGLQYHHPQTGRVESCNVRLGMMKADSPQRIDFCDHVGGNADLFCPKCRCRKFDLWDLDFPVSQHHYPPAFLDSVIALKSQLPPEQQEELKRRYGFHGNYNMFRELPFSPVTQLPEEPYHLWILGILRFFFKRIIKNVMKPFQRDQLNCVVAHFEFPRGLPRIQFDVTSATKNFSMTLMQQISIPFLYTLHVCKVDSRIVRFWSELDQFIRDLFDPVVLLSAVTEIQERGRRLLKTGKNVIPRATEKEPHNIHYALEYLFTELPIFVLAQVMAGVVEEHKHQPFKNGAHFTSGGSASSSQLVERDNLVSTLRYLIHGGSFGEGDKTQLDPQFRELCHPNNSLAPHPLSETLTSYVPSSTSSGPISSFPSKFFYEKKSRVSRTLTAEEKTFFAENLGCPPSVINNSAIPSKRFNTDSSSNFEVGDVASIISGAENE